MLSKADDFPVHQTPEPIAFTGTDRNFYDRYFFNGYHLNDHIFFAAALGQYPALNVTDAAFCVIVDGVQHSVFASRVLGMERLDTHVGPVQIDVVEPLEVLRLTIAPNDHGLEGNLTFTRRTLPVAEPRFTRRIGPSTLMDVTRMTQFGTWEGWFSVHGKRTDVSPETFRGTRDRSWGIRPVGTANPQTVAPPPVPQFYWLWAPLNFDDGATMFHTNDDADGSFWNRSAVRCPPAPDEASHFDACRGDVAFKPGTRHAETATLTLTGNDGNTVISLTPRFTWFMRGVGYSHPEWAHGTYHGDLATGGESFALAEANEADFHHNHIQAICDAVRTDPDGTQAHGRGVLEQLIVGPHAPSGFHDLFDMAP